jgi:hypothetical protein
MLEWGTDTAAGGAGEGAAECGCVETSGLTAEITCSNCLRQYGSDFIDAMEMAAARQQMKIPASGKLALDRRNSSEIRTPSTPITAPIAPMGTAANPRNGIQQITQAMIPSASDAIPNALCDGAAGNRMLTRGVACGVG